jgi:cation:H+ antiporter
MSADLQQLPLWLNSAIIVASMAIVGAGAHWVVESATRLSRRLGISELVIGLTVVALGTSAPEFAVTLIAAFKGQGDISIGNIVGSNIFNLGFILGGCALVRAIPVSRSLWRNAVAVLGGTTLLLLIMIGHNLRLDRPEGILLAVLLVAYLGYLALGPKDVDPPEDAVEETPQWPLIATCGLLTLGFIFIIGGSHLLILMATAVARDVGVSEWVIGVTVVAAGTSVPEFATSLVGVLRGKFALSAGNVIGSDIFNLLGVLGVAGTLAPIGVDPMARVSLVALCGMVLLLLFFMRTGWRISRFEGLLLIIVAALRWYFDFSASS